MDTHTDTRPQGAFSALLADQDLTHLELVLRRSLGDDSTPILPPSYWRERLALVARNSHLSHTQLQTVHRLYLQIEAYETRHPQQREMVPQPDPEPSQGIGHRKQRAV
jgi:hypothetical protein